MLVLALDSALGHCCAGIVRDGVVIAARAVELTRGHPAVLPMMARDVLAEAALRPSALDMVAVTVGPGSFTGVRAGLALAHGIGLGAGRPVIAVSVGEALAPLPGGDGGELHWSAIDSRRGRIFLERAGKVVSVALADLPAPPGAGNYQRRCRSRGRGGTRRTGVSRDARKTALPRARGDRFCRDAAGCGYFAAPSRAADLCRCSGGDTARSACLPAARETRNDGACARARDHSSGRVPLARSLGSRCHPTATGPPRRVRADRRRGRHDSRPCKRRGGRDSHVCRAARTSASGHRQATSSAGHHPGSGHGRGGAFLEVSTENDAALACTRP